MIIISKALALLRGNEIILSNYPEVKCLEVPEAVQRAVMDLGVAAEDEDAEAGGGLEAGAGHLLELVVGQVEAGEAGQGALVPPRPASFTSLTLLCERLRWTRLWRPHSSWSDSCHRPE